MTTDDSIASNVSFLDWSKSGDSVNALELANVMVEPPNAGDTVTFCSTVVSFEVDSAVVGVVLRRENRILFVLTLFTVVDVSFNSQAEEKI